MPFVYNFPFFSIMLCLIGGIVTPFVRKGWLAQKLNMLVILGSLGMNIALLVELLITNENFVYTMGHFPAPFGNELRGGPLEALLASCFCLVMALCNLGGVDTLYKDIRPQKQYLYFLMTNLLLCSMISMIYTNDLFTGYVFIEINTIAACAIVMVKESGETTVATIRYLIMSLLGSGLFLFGMAMLYGITGHLLMEDLQESILALAATGKYAVPLTVTIGMMALSTAVKSALFPFHSWLPGAHGSATTSASSILSGLVLKAYIILLIKIIYRVFTPELLQELHISDFLLVFGIAGMIVGSVKALKERHIKRMVAYSSVSQIGYIFMGIVLNSEIGMAAAILHLLAHAFTKPMLFCSAGALVETAGHQYDMKALKGSGLKNKLAGIGFTVGGLSMIGIPLLAGFAPKLYFSEAALGSDWFRLGVVLAALAVSTVLNALYYLPMIVNLWTPKKSQEPSHGDAHGASQEGHAAQEAHGEPAAELVAGEAAVLEEAHEAPRLTVSFVVSMVVFLACNVALGVAFGPIMDMIRTGLHLL